MVKMSNTLKYTIFLIVLGLISGGLLAFINSVTDPIIQERKEKEIQEKLENAFDFSTSKEVTSEFDNLGNNIGAIYLVGDENGKLLTVVYEVFANGYGGKVVTLIGVNPEGKIVNAVVADASTETKGFGSKLIGHDFKINDLEVENFDFKDMAQIISGATVSSDAAGTGINAAINHYKQNKNILIEMVVKAND